MGVEVGRGKGKEEKKMKTAFILRATKWGLQERVPATANKVGVGGRPQLKVSNRSKERKHRKTKIGHAREKQRRG